MSEEVKKIREINAYFDELARPHKEELERIKRERNAHLIALEDQDVNFQPLKRNS